MQRINGEALYEVIHTLDDLGGLLIHIEDVFDADKPMSAQMDDPKMSQFFTSVQKDVAWLREGLGIIGATLTDRTASELDAKLQDKTCTRSDINNACKDMGKRLKHEMSAIGVYLVDAKNKRLIESGVSLFGDDIVKAFPSVAYEVDEASKCLGLDRSTACVFHLMRVLEIGIKAASKCLSISDPIKDAERNWGAMLRKFKDEMTRRNSAKSTAWAVVSDKIFFDEIYVSLDAIRNVWRNATMHVEAKYLPDEAEHILIAVKGFMKKLSSRMDEDGKPLA